MEFGLWKNKWQDLSKYNVSTIFVGKCLPTTGVEMLVVSAFPTKLVYVNFMNTIGH